MDVTERLEGSYMSSQNRLSRIEVKVLLTFRGELLWQTQPTAQSSRRSPKLSTFQASRVAAKQTRSEEIEKLLYVNARGQSRIDSSVIWAACPPGLGAVSH